MPESGDVAGFWQTIFGPNLLESENFCRIPAKLGQILFYAVGDFFRTS
jgi:hypothetical protein